MSSFISSRELTWQTKAMVYNLAGTLLLLLGLFWPSLNYKILITTLISFPLLGVFIVWKSNGCVRFDDARREIPLQKSIVHGIMGPICALSVRAVLDSNHLIYLPLWLPAFSVGIAYLLMVLAADKEERKVGSVVVQFMIAAAYAASTVFLANCVFDASPAEANLNKIMNKHVSHTMKGPPIYELTIEPWKYSADPSEVSVSRETFDRLEVGEPIEILVKEGLFDAPWVVTVKAATRAPHIED
jgi:hypothetical protein